jgi:hypothetical protein
MQHPEGEPYPQDTSSRVCWYSLRHTQTKRNQNVRGPHGLAEIILKPTSRPVKQKMFQIQGERREAWIAIKDQIIADE